MHLLHKKMLTLLVGAMLLALLASAIIPASAAQAAGGAIPFFRLYNPTSGDHFYTTDQTEVGNAVIQYHYTYERIEGYVFAASDGSNGSTVPFYRLLSRTTGDHFYTTDWNEAGNAVYKYNYTYEEVAAYVYPPTYRSFPNGPIVSALYRLYNPTSGDHFYTLDRSEAVNAHIKYNYTYEGIAAYIYR